MIVNGLTDLNGKNGKDSTELELAGTPNAIANGNGVQKLSHAPVFLEAQQVNALIRFAPNPTARLCMILQWRAGLTIDEALAVTESDLRLTNDPPEFTVQNAHGTNDFATRTVPIHRHLGLSLLNAISMWKRPANEPIIDTTTQQMAAWYEEALKQCHSGEIIPADTQFHMNTLRHSAARRWLQNGVPINVVSKWLGHSDMTITLSYAEQLNDSGRFMERVH